MALIARSSCLRTGSSQCWWPCAAGEAVWVQVPWCVDVLPEILLWICMLILASINAGKIKQGLLLGDSSIS